MQNVTKNYILLRNVAYVLKPLRAVLTFSTLWTTKAVFLMLNWGIDVGKASEV
jgi:hypothetical protein